MRRTGYYFTHHKEIITEQYPDNKDTLVLADRFKGEVVMPHDEKNEHRCTGCTACELACPNGPMIAVSAAVAVLGGWGGLYLSYHAGIAAGASVAGVLLGFGGDAGPPGPAHSAHTPCSTISCSVTANVDSRASRLIARSSPSSEKGMMRPQRSHTMW